MTVRINTLIIGVAFAIVGVLGSPLLAEAQTARQRYERAQERDRNVRAVLDDTSANASAKAAALAEARKVVVAYDSLVRRFPISGYSDNALSNGGDLATLLFERFADPKDRATAIRLYSRLASEYPASSLIKRSEAVVARLERDRDTVVPALAVTNAAPSSSPSSPASSTTAPVGTGRPRLRSIDRTVLPGTVRVTLALDREVTYVEETLAGPARVFFDLKGVEAAPELVDAVLRYPTAAVRQIRVGRHPNSTVRVVLDLEGVSKHSVYTLYNPFRLIVDCETTTAAPVAAATSVAAPV